MAQDLLLEVEFLGPQPGSSVHVPSGCSPLQWESRVAVTANGPQASKIYCRAPYRKFANTTSKAAFPHSSTQKVTWSSALRERTRPLTVRDTRPWLPPKAAGISVSAPVTFHSSILKLKTTAASSAQDSIESHLTHPCVSLPPPRMSPKWQDEQTHN